MRLANGSATEFMTAVFTGLMPRSSSTPTASISHTAGKLWFLPDSSPSCALSRRSWPAQPAWMVCALNSSAASAPFSGRYRSLAQATFSATSLSFSRIFQKSSFSESLLPLWAPFLWATSGRRIRRCTKSANTNSETLPSPIFKSRHGSALSAPICLLGKAF